VASVEDAAFDYSGVVALFKRTAGFEVICCGGIKRFRTLTIFGSLPLMVPELAQITEPPRSGLPWTGRRRLEARRLAVRMMRSSRSGRRIQVICALDSHAVLAGHFYRCVRHHGPENVRRSRSQPPAGFGLTRQATFVVGAAGGRTVEAATSPNNAFTRRPLRGLGLASRGEIIEQRKVALGTCSAQLIAELRTS
jgi:hypothetical protein